MNRTTPIRGLVCAFALALISGCAQDSADTPNAEADVTAAPADSGTEIYVAALASELRPEADRDRDAARKPAEVLEFAGIKPGMTVLDMFSGSGWYAEIIAHVVGENGRVIAHSNEAYKNFVGDALEQRFGTGRVAQAEILTAENNQLRLQANSLDAIMLSLSFHDIYHVDAEGGWERIDGPAFLAELNKGLKPGGIVAIIDHRARKGAPPETGESLHRIDPALVVKNMEAAGFVLDAESDMLGNADDDLSKMVFVKEIRGQTDRFVMRFRKPE